MKQLYTNRLLKNATNRITRDLDQFAKKYDSTWLQMSVIDYLSRQDSDAEIYQRDIEKEFFIRRSTATVMLQRMEKGGFLYRRSSTTDARQKSVYLTPKAHNLEKEINQFMQRRQEILEENFSATDIQNFEKILKFYVNTEEI